MREANSVKKPPPSATAKRLIIAVVVAVLAAGAAIFSLYFRSSDSEPQRALSDCGWSMSLVAWIDSNANGVRDSGEEPLQGVAFRIDQSVRDSAVTDSRGVAYLWMFPAPCESMELSLSAAPPPGYEPTTARTMKVRTTGTAGRSFGFRRVGPT